MDQREIGPAEPRPIRSSFGRSRKFIGVTVAVTVALALVAVALIPRNETATTPDRLGGSVAQQPSADSGVSNPKILYRVQPEYSDEARKAKHQGAVLLGFEVWEDGLAHNIRVLSSLGLGLDEKAIEAIKKWKFSPGTKDGKPVRVSAQIQISFRLRQRDRPPPD